MAVKSKRKGPAKNQVIIAGQWWGVHTLTPRLNKKFLKALKETRPNITLRGYCDSDERKMYVRPNQPRQDHENTLLHEGLHALIYEIGCVHGISHVRHDEKSIETLTAEILGFMKQTALMPA